MSPELAAWSNFYVITGSSAGALTGLTFVVITLVGGAQVRAPRTPDGVGTFTSPTVVHFCVALFVSAALTAPWHLVTQAAVVIAGAGAFGVVYVTLILRRMYRIASDGRQYRPEFDDWLRYIVSPFVGYGLLLGGGAALPGATSTAMFVIAAGTLTLIFVGIHNAWDVVTFLAMSSLDGDNGDANGMKR